MSFGYAELTPDRHRFNTCILADKSARIVGKYRKTHLPGHRCIEHYGLITGRVGVIPPPEA
jgi:predicted amidohydrolase